MPIRVLHLDDNAADTTLLRLLLAEQPDFEHVGSVHDPEELEAALARLRPDVLVMDCRLDGRTEPDELVRRVLAAHPGTAVVGLSGFDDPELVAAMKAAGARAHVTKGAPIERLLEAIRNSRR